MVFQYFHQPVSYGATSQGSSDVPESGPTSQPAAPTDCSKVPPVNESNPPTWDTPINYQTQLCQDLNSLGQNLQN